MTTPAAVIFDVDGTLTDSERDGHRPAFNQAFAEAGLPYRWSVPEYGRLLATTGGVRRLRGFMIEQGYPNDEADVVARRLHARKTDLFREAGEIPSRPGAGRLVTELGDAGVPVAVATTGRSDWVAPLLERLFGLERFGLEWFACVLTGDDVGDGQTKPHPAVYLAALQRLGTAPADTVAVEDSRNGLDAAAGLACLVVVNDYTVDPDLGAAPLVVDRFGRPGRATVLAGPPDALDDGAVSPAKLGRIVGRPVRA